MNTHLIGKVQSLTVAREIETGYVLTKQEEDILLHHNDTKEPLEPDDTVDAFLYLDKQGRIIATTYIPQIQIDSYGWAEVIQVNSNLGVFIDIGISKSILVSTDDLPLLEDVWPAVGDSLYVTLGKDQKGRLLALPATEGIMAGMWEWAPEDLLNTTISGRVYQTGKEGTTLLTEEHYRGFIHHTERKQEPRLGEWVTGRVIDAKPDGTLNISLRPLKQDGMTEDATQILDYLHVSNGVIPFHDKSEPEAIRETFHISKAAFKRALGLLMKQGKIEQRNGQTYLKE